MPKAMTWGAIQRRWGSIVADCTVEQTKDLIWNVIDAEDDFATYSLLLILKYRWDCPDIVFELLDEIFALQARRAPEQDIEAWGERARAALRRLVGVDTDASRRLVN